jgi:hypothetical protein
MPRQLNANGRGDGSGDRLVVVGVEDAIKPQLTGHAGATYQSPPQAYEQAMALVRVLLGRTEDGEGKRQWTAPIARGRRVVTLTEETNR